MTEGEGWPQWGRDLPPGEEDRLCHWCLEWEKREVEATAWYEPAQGCERVYVCALHLLRCGPKGIVMPD